MSQSLIATSFLVFRIGNSLLLERFYLALGICDVIFFLFSSFTYFSFLALSSRMQILLLLFDPLHRRKVVRKATLRRLPLALFYCLY